jgi:FdhD protein
VSRAPIAAFAIDRQGRGGPCDDELVVEEPLEIRLGDVPLAVVMRTPGHDVELAAGFVLTEAIVPDAGSILSIAYCQDVEDAARGNVVRVLADRADRDAMERARRAVYASSSCGLCGKATLDSVRMVAPPIEPIPPLSSVAVRAMIGGLAARQSLFGRTGGLHGAALCASGGEVEAVREDIGRHNACDKLIGSAALADTWPIRGRVLVVSGRASFEIVQKAAMAGIPAIVAVSAPSSLAVEFARSVGMGLVGFARGDSMNVYSPAPG